MNLKWEIPVWQRWALLAAALLVLLLAAYSFSVKANKTVEPLPNGYFRS